MKLAMRVQAVSKKVTLITTAFILAVSTLTASLPFILSQNANAVGTVEISSVAELCNAIDNQADGQVWTITAGVYGLGQCNSIEAEGQTGWYLPITANNLTVNGIGNPTIYGTGFTANGAWHMQNLVSVFGDNVSMSGLTLMPKVDPNKTIEVLGDNFTLSNTTIMPNTLATADYAGIANAQDRAEAKEWGGSIYFSHAGSHTLNNVTIKNGGVSFRYAPTGTHIAFNNVKLENTTNIDWINQYRISTAFNNSGNSTAGLPVVVYNVNDVQNNLESVLASVKDNDVININSDLSVSKQLTLTKAVTVNGNGNTVTGNYTKTDYTNNSVIGVQSDDVKINNLTVNGVDGAIKMLHGINIYNSDDVELTNITANNGRSGVVVNGSTVTIDGIHTSGNIWNGVNVDNQGAHLTIKGENVHADADGAPAIYADDKSVGIVNDVNHQYSSTDAYVKPADRAYFPKLATPVLVSPSANGYTTTNVFNFDWSDVQGAASYEFQNSLTGATNGNGSLATVNYSAKPTNSLLPSSGAADGTVRYWQVRAVDAHGAKSDWSAPWKMTIDMSAPVAPILTSPAANGFVTGNPVQKWTQSNSADVDHYLYESYSDSALSNLVYGTDTHSTQRAVAGNQNVVIWWRVAAVDKAGNKSFSAAQKLTIDNQKPSVVLDDLGQSVVRGTVTVKGEVTDNFALSHYNLSLYNGTVDLSDGETHSGDRIATTGWVTGGQTNVNGASASVSRDLNTDELTDGTYQVRLAAKDKAGNAEVKVFSFTVDNTDPELTLTNLSTSSTTPVLSGTIGESTKSIKVAFGGNEYFADNNNDGTWTLQLGAVTPGNYPLVVTATDLAGNESTATGSLSVVAFSSTTGGDNTNTNNGDQTTTTVSTTVPSFTSPASSAQVLGDETAGDTINPSGAEDVKGTSTEKNFAEAATTNTDGKAFGLAWYWWLLIVAGVMTIVWWIVSAVRSARAQA